MAYKHDNSIKHYLVKPDEKKSLPDFVNETPFFNFVLKLKINSQGNAEGLTRCPKQDALAPFALQQQKNPTQMRDEGL